MSNARQLAANLPREGGLSNRNLIINGAMQVAQRGTSFTNVTTKWAADRFIAYVDGMGTFDVSNVSDAPSGFSNSIKWACNTADAAPSGNDEAFIQTILEAQNLQHLNYGSSDAETITVSFWVKSSETGAFGIWLYAPDGVRAFDTSYTITSANVWEKKTVTISGDTSGLINNDTGAGLYIRWYMGAAAVGTMTSTWRSPADVVPTGGPNIQGATGRTFYLTGVQLELGDTATPFEHRSYGDELARCQRYYEEYEVAAEYTNVSVNGAYLQSGPFAWKVTKRANPTISSNMTDANYSDTWGYAQAGYTVSTKYGTAAIATLGDVSGFGIRATGATYSPTPIALRQGWSGSYGKPKIYADSEL